MVGTYSRAARVEEGRERLRGKLDSGGRSAALDGAVSNIRHEAFTVNGENNSTSEFQCNCASWFCLRAS